MASIVLSRNTTIPFFFRISIFSFFLTAPPPVEMIVPSFPDNSFKYSVSSSLKYSSPSFEKISEITLFSFSSKYLSASITGKLIFFDSQYPIVLFPQAGIPINTIFFIYYLPFFIEFLIFTFQNYIFLN